MGVIAGIMKGTILILHEFVLLAFWLAVVGILAGVGGVLLGAGTLGTVGGWIIMSAAVAVGAMIAGAVLPGEPAHIPFFR